MANFEHVGPIAQRVVSDIGEKFCPGCNRTLPLDQFQRNSARRDGRQTKCRRCWNAYVMSRTAKEIQNAQRN